MKKMEIMKDMWIQPRITLPPTLWIFTKNEFKEVIDVLQTSRTPKNYKSLFEYKFVDNKIIGMKTHN